MMSNRDDPKTLGSNNIANGDELAGVHAAHLNEPCWVVISSVAVNKPVGA